MSQPWYIRFGWWLCELFNHPIPKKGWIYDGHYHRDCRWCGRIASEPIHTRGQTNDLH